ncbi:MAG: glycosyltransferase family 4 protein [Limisphaerales bacterium]
MPEVPPRPRIALLQRAIAHYRFPLFVRLHEQSAFEWVFFSDKHDQRISTGLPAEDLHRLPHHPIRNRSLYGPITWQSGLRLRGFDGLLMDLGWPILSNPRYLLEARSRGMATIGWSKGIPQVPGQRESPAKRIYQRFILSLCDALVLYGEISRGFFRQLGFPENRMFVAQNTIDTRRIAISRDAAVKAGRTLRDRLRVGQRFVFGYLGALISRKRVGDIIAAFNQARADGDDCVLVVAGDGPERTALERAARASPYHADILLPGRIPAGEEDGWFQLFDAYLSFAQGGLGILEAMAHGRVVVSTPERYPETELLVDGDTALLAGGFSINAFATVMRRAFASRSSLAAIGERARDCVLARATLENMVCQIDRAVACGLARHGHSQHFLNHP